jgi:tRNA A-37 threonylcarbamoyl transferase component Bud32
MEFVEGARTLKDDVAERARRGQGMVRAEMRAILGQVVDGLEAAHERKLVHRDIKPENIMLQAVAGNANFVRILDFGLAKDLAQGDETSIAMGTPTYMAADPQGHRPVDRLVCGGRDGLRADRGPQALRRPHPG